MECLIGCYLDQFVSAPRNTLHDHRKRRSAVEYINILITGCMQGQETNQESVVRAAIIAILRYHDQNRFANGAICMMGKYHNILYVAVKLCFDWQLKDTATVVALLEDIYYCEKSFERIFIGALFGNMAPHYIAGWKSDFDSQEENLRAVVYFIDHATNGELEVANHRFVDAPIESCGRASPLKISLQLGLPDKVHIFLRYGAVVEKDCLDHLLRRLMEFCRVYPYNLVACLQLLLRVIPRIEGSSGEILDNYSELVEDRLIPQNRCGLQVPELKHLAKCAIRRRLWRNYQLPNGIRFLSLPDSLKRYVDILED